MVSILHDFFVKMPKEKVFHGFATAEGLDKWWTKNSTGKTKAGEEYTFCFGPGYEWKGVVVKCSRNKAFEWVITEADADWKGTHVGVVLKAVTGGTQVRFYHKGWAAINDHYRISCYCWAMYWPKR